MGDAVFPESDVKRVRTLAGEMMKHAQSDEFERRRQRWRDANSRRKPDRAPVWCGMAGVSRELFKPETLECSDPLCRQVEDAFRRRLYKCWVGDDEIFDPWWSVPVAWDCSTEYTFGLPTRVSTGSTAQGGFRYHHPIESVEDYAKITVPEFSYNRDKTEERLSQMADLLGDVMPVRMSGSPPLTPNHSVYLEQLRGMEAMLGDLAFRPELVHRALARITEAVLGALRVAEKAGVLTRNDTSPMTCSDPVGELFDDRVGLNNMWCGANSQEFQMVSPAMQEEFLLNYQIPCLQQFGAVQYGCCEDLTQKIDIVRAIPNLRIFVCSYWTDIDKLITLCGDEYTIMWRQLSAHVMLPDDLDGVRKDLATGTQKLQGVPYQIILREVETLAGHPDRLKEWTELAISAAEEFA
jgi:hypothetical protein